MQGFLGSDCAYEAKALQLGQQAQMAESSFEYDLRRLPDMSGLAAGHNVEVALEVAWSSHKFRDWTRGRPELLLLQVITKNTWLLKATSVAIQACG